MAVVCILLVGTDAWRLNTSRNAQLAETEITTGNLARSVAQQAQTTVAFVNSILTGVVERVRADEVAPAPRPDLHGFLARRAAEMPQLLALFVYDGDGNLTVGSLPTLPAGVNSRDREYFQHHLSVRDSLPHLGQAVRSGAAGEWVVTLSRRLETADGRFLSVAPAAIAVNRFVKVYSTFNLGAQSGVSLIRDDGTLLVRYPFDPAYLDISLRGSPLFRDHLTQAEQGTYTAPSRFDGVVRVISYHRMPEQRMVALVAVVREYTLADWWQAALGEMATVGATCVLICFFGWQLTRQIGRRAVAERSARERDAHYRALADSVTDLIMRLDGQGRRSYVSPSCTEVLGYSRDEMLAEPVGSYAVPEDRERVAAAVASTFAGAEGMVIGYHARRKDGKIVWLEAQLSLIHDTAGGSAGEPGASELMTVRR